MNPSKSKNLNKYSLFELEEMLSRQKKLLQNTKLLCNLADKGVAVKEVHDSIATEVENRKKVAKLSELLDKLDLKAEHISNHAEYVCSKEKAVDKNAKPLTLRTKDNNSINENNQSKVIYIPLPESLEAEQKSHYSHLELKLKECFASLIPSDKEESSSEEESDCDYE